MLNAKSWVTLIIQTGSLETEKVSKALKLDPDYFQNPELQEDGTIEESGIWQINSLLDPEESLENHLWSILKRLVQSRNEVKNLIQPPVKAVFYCSTEFVNQDISDIKLSSRLLLLIGGLGIDLEINYLENDEINQE